MKFRRIQFPGRTLIVGGIDQRYSLFLAWFLQLWNDRFGAAPELALGPRPGDLSYATISGLARQTRLPAGFFALWWFFVRGKFKTIVILDPNLAASRRVRIAAYLARTTNRAGFAPLRKLSGLNFSLPFNNENHHYVHQLKTFFEYLTGEKVAQWNTPLLRARENSAPPPSAGAAFGLVACNVDEPESEHVLQELRRLINLVTRTGPCVLVLRSQNLPLAAIQRTARLFSEVMTEQAIEQTTLLMNPDENELIAVLLRASWATGLDTELLNLAALAGVPALALFGPLNERIWQPFSVRSRTLTGEFPCRPCTAYPGGVNCTNDVPWICISSAKSELMVATLAGMLRRRHKAGS